VSAYIPCQAEQGERSVYENTCKMQPIEEERDGKGLLYSRITPEKATEFLKENVMRRNERMHGSSRWRRGGRRIHRSRTYGNPPNRNRKSSRNGCSGCAGFVCTALLNLHGSNSDLVRSIRSD